MSAIPLLLPEVPTRYDVSLECTYCGKIYEATYRSVEEDRFCSSSCRQTIAHFIDRDEWDFDRKLTHKMRAALECLEGAKGKSIDPKDWGFTMVHGTTGGSRYSEFEVLVTKGLAKKSGKSRFKWIQPRVNKNFDCGIEAHTHYTKESRRLCKEVSKAKAQRIKIARADIDKRKDSRELRLHNVLIKGMSLNEASRLDKTSISALSRLVQKAFKKADLDVTIKSATPAQKEKAWRAVTKA